MAVDDDGVEAARRAVFPERVASARIDAWFAPPKRKKKRFPREISDAARAAQTVVAALAATDEAEAFARIDGGGPPRGARGARGAAHHGLDRGARAPAPRAGSRAALEAALAEEDDGDVIARFLRVADTQLLWGRARAALAAAPAPRKVPGNGPRYEAPAAPAPRPRRRRSSAARAATAPRRARTGGRARSTGRRPRSPHRRTLGPRGRAPHGRGPGACQRNRRRRRRRRRRGGGLATRERRAQAQAQARAVDEDVSGMLSQGAQPAGDVPWLRRRLPEEDRSHWSGGRSGGLPATSPRRRAAAPAAAASRLCRSTGHSRPAADGVEEVDGKEGAEMPLRGAQPDPARHNQHTPLEDTRDAMPGLWGVITGY